AVYVLTPDMEESLPDFDAIAARIQGPAMSALEAIDLLLAGATCVLAVALAAVYWRNHRQLRSPFTLGLLLFALFLLVNNAIVLYDAWSMMMLGGNAWLALVREGLQTAASAALLVATLR